MTKMSDAIQHDIWALLKTALFLLIYIGIAYLAVRIFHETIRELFHGIGFEIRSLISLKPSARALNAFFGFLIFVVVLLMFAAEEIAEAQWREVIMPSVIVILIGLFALVVFFSLSFAFCIKAES